MFEVEMIDGYIFCENWEFLDYDHYELINASLLVDGIMTTLKRYVIIADETISIKKTNFKEAFMKINLGGSVWK